jgi:hypothetical protein
MRLSLGVAMALIGLVPSALAQPIDPYADQRPAPPPPPPAPPGPIDPYAPTYPPPPAYGYQPPAAGVGQPQGPTPQYQQGYYLYPTPGAPPVYYAPPPSSYALRCAACVPRRPPRRWDGVRRWSLGAHLMVLGIGQKIGDHDMTLGGAGFQLRLRSRGRFGFEASQSFLGASYWDGGFQRNSYPFQISFMAYLFPNQDARHFNLYLLAGAGVMSDSIQLYDENRQKVTQGFVEWDLHAGIGAELRIRCFASAAAARALGLFRDDNLSTPYYAGVTGAPVPSKTWGVQGRVYLSFWF